MKMKSAIFAWMTLMLLNGCGLITPGQKKSVSESQKERPVVHVPLADPFILLHDGTYYAYGTKAEHGIAVFESDDLQTWRQASGRAAEGLALHKDDVYGDRWFWAPEVYCINGAFYMFFSAQSHVCVAVSDSPLGPFVQKEKKLFGSKKKRGACSCSFLKAQKVNLPNCQQTPKRLCVKTK